MISILNNLIKKETGAAIVTALIVLIVLSLLGTALFFSMMTEGRQSIRYGNRTQAYYLARTGAEIAYAAILHNLYDNAGTLITIDNVVPDNFVGTLEGIGTYNVQNTFSEKSEENTYEVAINSTGIKDGTGGTSYTVQLILELNVIENIVNPEEWFAGSSHNIQHNHASNNPFPNKRIILKSKDGIKALSVTGNPARLVAYSIHFVVDEEQDVVSALIISQNDTVILDAVFIQFDSGISVARAGQSSNHSRLRLDNSHEGIQGYFDDKDQFSVPIYDFTNNVNYGVIYFDDDKPIGGKDDLTKGYYFFPHGCELHDLAFNGKDKGDVGLIRVREEDEDKVRSLMNYHGSGINSKTWY